MECPFCVSNEIGNARIPRSTIFNEKVFNYKLCKKCKLVFIDPIPVTSDYQKMYSSNYHESFYFKEQAIDFAYLEPVMSKYNSDKSLLDYGCGDATFLKYFQSKGYNVSGTEYDPDLVLELSKQNPSIQFSSISDFWSNSNYSKFNFIHLGDVFEHLDKPREFLQMISSKLEPETGILLVEGPLENNKSLAFFVRYLTSSVIGWLSPGKKAAHIPYHITFSNFRNQKRIFETCGFDTVAYKIFETTWPYPSKPSKSPGSILKYLIAKTSIFISRLFPKMQYGNRFIFAGRLKKILNVQ